MVNDGEEVRLKAHLPPNRLEGKMINGVDAIDLGSEPILFMRSFMQNKTMDTQLIQKIKANTY